jgi:O-acetyl-ADP-ribose deacetylase (regulator of RNase III)
MIKLQTGNLLEAKTEALVNTVNCVGVMGKGIALQFKQAYPEVYKEYKRACDKGELRPGSVQVVATRSLFHPRYVINFPTKDHWKGKSKLADIRTGLKSLVDTVTSMRITSIAIPPLGCGNGGLDWAEIRPLIEDAFAPLPEVEVSLYQPVGAPSAMAMPVGTKKPNLTFNRALVMKLWMAYTNLDFDTELNQLVVQKLCYFLQNTGQDLKLKFVRGAYGPYADNLKFVLQALEGHYTRGYGDKSSPNTSIELLIKDSSELDEILKSDPDAVTRLLKVLNLVDSFHSPYLLELLSTVHFVASESEEASSSYSAVVAAVKEWSERKESLFRPKDVKLAWEHLKEQGWIATPKIKQSKYAENYDRINWKS